jgi:L-lactate dehydrogenase complex protein LldF
VKGGVFNSKVCIFSPCVARALFPDILIETKRVIEVLGFESVIDRKATCCGQMFFNNGMWSEAKTLAKRFVRLFCDAPIVVAPTWSCVEMVRQHYGEILDDPGLVREWESLRTRVFEITEFIAKRCSIASWGGELKAKAVFHYSCHMPKDEKTRQEIQDLFGGIRGLEVFFPPSEHCCGFGGSFFAFMGAVSEAIGEERLKRLEHDKFDFIVSSEPGCMMHLLSLPGKDARLVHTVQILSGALRSHKVEPLVVPLMEIKGKGVPHSDFYERAKKASCDVALRQKIVYALDHAVEARRKAIQRLGNYEFLKAKVKETREMSVAEMQSLWHVAQRALEQKGIKVHFACDSEEARKLVVEIAKSCKARLVVKGKSMTSEEVGVREALLETNAEVVETDLGEFIVTLRGERASHLVAPALHLSRRDVQETFERLGFSLDSDDPQCLAEFARAYLRNKFLSAEMGVFGVNVVCAQEGILLTVTNEGNGRLCISLPKVVVGICGLEKVVPSLRHACDILRVLPVNATGQTMTSYVSFLGGVGGGHDGREVHLIVVDNGRTRIAKDATMRPILSCIRCGACSNVCPVYRVIGGHAYGAVYSGPMGILWTLALYGVEKNADLLDACTLCGECSKVCPAGIDIARIIRLLRGKVFQNKKALRLAYFGLKGTTRFRVAMGLYRFSAKNATKLVEKTMRALGIRRRFMPFPRKIQTHEYLRNEKPVDSIPLFLTKDKAHRDKNNGAFSPQSMGNDDVLGLFTRMFTQAGGEVMTFQEILKLTAGKVVVCDEKTVPSRVIKALSGNGAKIVHGLEGAKEATFGLTGCKALVAETGSVLLGESSVLESLLPEVHIVIALKRQFVETLDVALDGFRENIGCLVTGPSRTADIEKRLILGMHGPKRVILCVLEANDGQAD